MTPAEADEQLRQALIAHARAHGMLDGGEEFIELGAVGAWLERDDEVTYTLHYPSPIQAVHRMEGLLTRGLRELDRTPEG